MEENNREKKTRELANILELLPDEALDAVGLVIKNMGLIEEMCREDDMAKEAFEKYMEKARKKKDCFSQILLSFAKIHSKKIR